MLLGSTAVVAAVGAPVSYACPFGQVFEYDGCVPSPLLYSWTSSSPTATTTPSVCVWNMPWGSMNLPCNIINCQTIIYPPGYTLQSQPVLCSSLSVSVQRTRPIGPPVPVAGDKVYVSASLICEGPADRVGPVYINVSMTEETDSQGNARFLIPTTLDRDVGGSQASCYDFGSHQTVNSFLVREMKSGIVSVGLSWPDQQSVVLSLPPVTGAAVGARGHLGWFVL